MAHFTYPKNRYSVFMEDAMLECAGAGFDRPMTEPLANTVKFYQRHVFICTPHAGWPAHIEQDEGFAQTLGAAIARQARAVPRVVKLSACAELGGPAAAAGPGHDLLVFPDMMRYRGLQESDIAALVEDHLVGDRVSARLPHEPLAGRHLFVCCHAARDARCGCCGPVLAELLAAEVACRGLRHAVTVRQTSHVGGHQYAGNVLIYPEGDWYGYVTPADVPRLVEQHIQHGTILTDIWRGRMARS